MKKRWYGCIIYLGHYRFRFWVYTYDFMEKIQNKAKISARHTEKICGWLNMNKSCKKSINSLECGFFCSFFNIKKNYGFSEV